MKILMINKFLYVVGGAETYMFNVADELSTQGHEIEFFGLDNSKNKGFNRWNIYVESYDDKKIFNPFSLIYNKNAKRKMNEILDKYKPDIVHFNNISYHLTSSIIDACKRRHIPMVMTIHDPQLVCPNHMFYKPEGVICEECLDKNFKHCLEHSCIKGSKLKSYLGYKESVRTHKNNSYDGIKLICPSQFIQGKLKEGGFDNSVFLRNPFGFSSFKEEENTRGKYILYFGRINQEKGIDILLKALPDDVNLVIAGNGPLVESLPKKDNIQYVGMKSGDELKNLIKHACFAIYPSSWYENCPMSIIEAISLGTPVIGTNLGGIPELIENNVTGLLFNHDDIDDLRAKINLLYHDDDLQLMMRANASKMKLTYSLSEYVNQLLKIYTTEVDHAKTAQ